VRGLEHIVIYAPEQLVLKENAQSLSFPPSPKQKKQPTATDDDDIDYD
jgi:hypothetical protein